MQSIKSILAGMFSCKVTITSKFKGFTNGKDNITESFDRKVETNNQFNEANSSKQTNEDFQGYTIICENSKEDTEWKPNKANER
jgi:hypothetical protein